MRKVLIGVVRLYQWTLSPLLVAIGGESCRFTPSCSQYAIEALAKHGAIKGAWYAVYRVLRCQPFARGGFDPVPDSDRLQSNDSLREN